MSGESQRGDGHEGGAPRKRGAALVAASFNLRHGLAWDGRHSWPLRRRAAARCLGALRRRSRRPAGGPRLPAALPGAPPAAATRPSAPAATTAASAASAAPCCTGPAACELDSWTVRWFSDTPGVPGSRSWGNPVTRLVTLCRFRDRAGGREFGVADTHWDGASAASRLRSAEALLGWLDPALPWIVLGDLNATAGDPAVARLVAGGLRDTLAHLGERGPGAGTHHHWDGATDGTRIDYVLVIAAVGGARRATSPTSCRRRPLGLPSDHWPVVGDAAAHGLRAGRERSAGRRRSGDHVPARARPLRVVAPHEGVVLQVAQRELQLLAGVHDEGPVARDRLAQRLAADQQEAHGVAARLHADLVAVAEDGQARRAEQFAVQVAAVAQVAAHAELALALEHVGEGRVPARHRLRRSCTPAGSDTSRYSGSA